MKRFLTLALAGVLALGGRADGIPAALYNILKGDAISPVFPNLSVPGTTWANYDVASNGVIFPEGPGLATGTNGIFVISGFGMYLMADPDAVIRMGNSLGTPIVFRIGTGQGTITSGSITVTNGGQFIGNGAGLTNLPAASIVGPGVFTNLGITNGAYGVGINGVAVLNSGTLIGGSFPATYGGSATSGNFAVFSSTLGKVVDSTVKMTNYNVINDTTTVSITNTAATRAFWSITLRFTDGSSGTAAATFRRTLLWTNAGITPAAGLAAGVTTNTYYFGVSANSTNFVDDVSTGSGASIAVLDSHIEQ